MIADVQGVVETITVDRARFERFCRSLSAEELRRPVPDSTWQVKDFISHLATIDPPITTWLAGVADGKGAALGGQDGRRWDVDAYNDHEVAQRRDRSVDEILAEAAQTRAAMLPLFDRLTAEQAGQTMQFGGDSKRPPTEIALLRYLRGWARHDAIHVADMLKALPERRADPEVAAWLAEPEVANFVGGYQQAMA